MVIFKSASEYVGTCASLAAKIAAIELIQEALLTTAMRAVEQGDISQYSLNDGQVIISTTYRNSTEITNAYNSFERIKQMFINRKNGRMIRLVDYKTFDGKGNHF